MIIGISLIDIAKLLYVEFVLVFTLCYLSVHISTIALAANAVRL